MKRWPHAPQDGSISGIHAYRMPPSDGMHFPQDGSIHIHTDNGKHTMIPCIACIHTCPCPHGCSPWLCRMFMACMPCVTCMPSMPCTRHARLVPSAGEWLVHLNPGLPAHVTQHRVTHNQCSCHMSRTQPHTAGQGQATVQSHIAHGPFFLVAAGDWFGSQHMGPHSPREAPHVCTV
jgi:hypothetical protein